MGVLLMMDDLATYRPAGRQLGVALLTRRRDEDAGVGMLSLT